MLGFLFISMSSMFLALSLLFSSRNNVGAPSREDRETALMRCMHHLRAASGERSSLHVGLVATTPLFEEETYRKVCRMGRDAPFSAKMNYAHLHQGAILGHSFCPVLMALFLQVSSSLAPMQVCWRMLHCPAAKPRVATGQGREVFFPRHKCSVESTKYLMCFFC